MLLPLPYRMPSGNIAKRVIFPFDGFGLLFFFLLIDDHRCMDISYLAPCKGSLSITVTPFQHIESPITPTSHHKQLTSSSQHQADKPANKSENKHIDTFRVVIRKASKEGIDSDQKGKKRKNQQSIYAQGMIVLY